MVTRPPSADARPGSGRRGSARITRVSTRPGYLARRAIARRLLEACYRAAAATAAMSSILETARHKYLVRWTLGAARLAEVHATSIRERDARGVDSRRVRVSSRPVAVRRPPEPPWHPACFASEPAVLRQGGKMDNVTVARQKRSSYVRHAALFAVAVLIVAPATGVQAQSCVPAPSGIVSWYTMDGSTADRQMANTPSSTNAVSFVAGEVGQGAAFGSGGFIDIPDSASLQLQRITLDAWARPDGPGPNNDAAGSIIVGKNTDNNGVSVQLAWTAQSGGRFRFNFPGSSIVSADPFPAGSFYFVAGTYDGATFRLYVNGTLEGSVSSVTTISYTSLPWDIGANTPGARSIGFPRTWNGVIDEVEILNRALSAS